MSEYNPALEPVTLTLTALEVEVLQLALIRLLPEIGAVGRTSGEVVTVRALVEKIRDQRLAAPARVH